MINSEKRAYHGRKPAGYTAELPQHVPVRQEIADAIEHLAAVTGVSKAHIVREAVEKYLAELGLVCEQPVATTTYRRKS